MCSVRTRTNERALAESTAALAESQVVQPLPLQTPDVKTQNGSIDVLSTSCG